MQLCQRAESGASSLLCFLPPSSQRLFQGDQMALLLVTVTLSMMTTPLLMARLISGYRAVLMASEENDEKAGVGR